MLDNLKNEFNKTKTQNNAFAYKSTQSNLLDLFSMGGAFRNRTDRDVEKLVSKAFNENKLLTIKTLFYIRDIRGGQGERRFFRVAIKYLAKHHTDSLRKNLHLIPEFGRWDDLWVLLETSLKDDVVNLVGNQLLLDKHSEEPSLLAKWMPSENASSPTTKKYARIFCKSFKVKPRKYRKLLSKLRKKIDVLEIKMTDKDYSNIDYSKIPSRAGLIYRDAFYRNDFDNYTDFLDKLSKGEVSINAETLYPYDIVRESLKGYSGRNIFNFSRDKISEEEIKLLDAQWKSLKDYVEDKDSNALAVVDTSGSMSGTPMEVAISLGLYLAERNNGEFKNHFMTFSSNPQLQEVVGSNIVEKVRNLSDSDWEMSTNIEAVFNRILDSYIDNDVPKEDEIKKVIIISDMQFDSCVRDAESHIFQELDKIFKEHGYEMPSLVFWNVNAFTTNTQFTMNEQGVQLVSGFSPSLFKNVLGGLDLTPYELMLEVINSDRYKDISV